MIRFAETTRQRTVGASVLAMDVNDNAGCLNPRGVSAFFASKLAPTGFAVFRAVFHYNFVIKLLVGCPDRLVNLNSLSGQPPAATLPL
ncbi:hypothetical protein [Pseudomonas sp. 18173]|uniref:hypothetical protein n=1 Tax=Pseudomonas sp. 18173 TaxID=3390055 RepID=UPI003D1D7E00